MGNWFRSVGRPSDAIVRGPPHQPRFLHRPAPFRLCTAHQSNPSGAARSRRVDDRVVRGSARHSNSLRSLDLLLAIAIGVVTSPRHARENAIHPITILSGLPAAGLSLVTLRL
jgi:hypothetical protein